MTSRRRRVGIYNKWWATAGGGEKYAGGIAQALSADDEVVLIAHEPFDVDELGERLDLDLSKTATLVVDDHRGAVSEASEDLDVFINVSFTSDADNRAPVGLYVTHFPTRSDPSTLLESGRRRLADRLRAEPQRAIRIGAGFHPSEKMRGIETRWTDGDARFGIDLIGGRPTEVTVELGRYHAPILGPVAVTITDELTGATVASTTVTPRSSRRDLVPTTKVGFSVDDQLVPGTRWFRVTSPSFDPSVQFGSGDERRLGIPVVSIRTGSPLAERATARLASPQPPFLGTYDVVLANSAFTKQWIRRYWSVESEVLYPIVSAKPRQDKAPIILSVGRFFGGDSGHSKKQLEMVSAFSSLLRSGVEGWEYHLVGGCERSNRGYLREVRNAAAGMPVHIHVDASGETLNKLYGAASIFWHATGLGEQPDASPDKLEHFGITTAEAMSAGAVPVVIGMAGQLETVEDNVSGHHFHDLPELVSLTSQLIGDPERLAQMSMAAEKRAQMFGWDAFSERVKNLSR